MKLENSVKDTMKPWFMEEKSAAERVLTLDPEIRPYVESLIEDGFAVIKRSVSKEMCRDLIEKFKRFALLNRDKFDRFLDADGHFPRIVNLHAAMPELFRLFSENRIAYRVQEAMYGARPCLYTSLFYERGSAQPLHRDTPVFSTRPEYYYLGVWVALEDANLSNGALQVCRGGHKLPELPRQDIALEHFATLDEIPPTSNDLWRSYQRRLQLQCDAAGLTTESLCVEAGDTVIWHPQLPHGGGPIGDLTKSRFSLVMHTTPVGVPVYHQDKFFNPEGDANVDAQWWYEESDGAIRVLHNEINFGHKESFPVSSFVVEKHEENTCAREEIAPPRKTFLRRLMGR